MRALRDRIQSNVVERNPNVRKIFQTKVKQTPSNDNAEKLKVMADYIEQDGCEKANEIDISADEECRIIISHRSTSVDEHLEKKIKQTLKEDVLEESKTRLQWRLHFLCGKQAVVDHLLSKVKKRYENIMKNEQYRKSILAKLMLQAALKILEPTVFLRVQEEDFGLAQQLIPCVQENYSKVTGLSMTIILDKLYPLPTETGGGVQLRTPDNRIFVNNLVTRRIELCIASVHPLIRTVLFDDVIHPLMSEGQIILDHDRLSEFSECSL
nr:PREDICTED: V-type proton ATPase subunit E 2-like [Bemisia tabaci]